MSGDTQLVLWIAGVHLVGLMCVGVLLLPALRDNPPAPNRHSDSDGDDGWGRGPKRPPKPPTPPGGGIPLLDAQQSRTRFREAGRLADRLPRRGRRPAREPARDPVRTPARNGSGSQRCSGSGR